MTSYLELLVVISLCYAGCKATSSCERKIAVSYLDTAIDMITKAKTSIPPGIHYENNATRRVADCSELLQMGNSKSGVYTIWPASRITKGKSLQVYCDMRTDGGGWTMIQRRGNFQKPVDYFFKDWTSYKEGFGNIEKDFWLGNDNIFALTNQNLYSVRFDLRDVENNSKYAQYDTFWIEDEIRLYTIHISGYTGDAGDDMKAHNDKAFSTKDKDNDNHNEGSCAQMYKGGWWYGKCHGANLNGLYHRGKHESYADGVNWKSWKGYNESLESTEIKIRPENFKLHQVSFNTPM